MLCMTSWASGRGMAGPSSYGTGHPVLAEDAGFEPARGFIPNTISNRAH